MRFKNKVAIIASGNTCIGLSIIEGILSAEGKVIIVGPYEPMFAKLNNEYLGKILFFDDNITESGVANKLVKFSVKEFGRIDIIINNACYATIKPLMELLDEDINKLLDLNLKALLLLSREAISELSKNKGVIVNLGSNATQIVSPGYSVYSAVKAGSDQITKILSEELKSYGIRVNSVLPGLTNTRMTKEIPDEIMDKLLHTQMALHRIKKPNYIAKTILWLASDDSDWVTGKLVQACDDADWVFGKVVNEPPKTKWLYSEMVQINEAIKDMTTQFSDVVDTKTESKHIDNILHLT
jgi:NAD(P)-dependent dehydrogenase (short-subunit alcohol dehydrogenase family)